MTALVGTAKWEAPIHRKRTMIGLFGLSWAQSMIVLAFLTVLVFFPICRFLSSCLSCLPEQHRKLEQGRVWLLLIPIFNIVWQFFVLPNIAKSFQDYFAAHGRR